MVKLLKTNQLDEVVYSILADSSAVLTIIMPDPVVPTPRLTTTREFLVDQSRRFVGNLLVCMGSNLVVPKLSNPETRKA